MDTKALAAKEAAKEKAEAEAAKEKETKLEILIEKCRIQRLQDADAMWKFQSEIASMMKGSVDPVTYQKVQELENYAEKQHDEVRDTKIKLQEVFPIRGELMGWVTSRWFDYVILFLIMANCVVLGIENPLEKGEKNIFDVLEWIFNISFTLEMIVKITALGFIGHEHCYMRNPWNVVDFIIVIISWVTSFFGNTTVYAVRAVRALRAIRMVSVFPRMRKLVTALLDICVQMAKITVLVFTAVLVFGCIAMQLFMGTLNNRCIEESSLRMPGYKYEEKEFFCQLDSKIRQVYADQMTATTYPVKDPTDMCPTGFICLMKDNPYSGQIHFDNIFQSSLMIFEMFTMDGWADVMYLIRKAHTVPAEIGGPKNRPALEYDVFFISVIYVGAFFLMNLVIAVQFQYYNLVKKTHKLSRKKEVELEIKTQEEKDKSCYSIYLKREERWCTTLPPIVKKIHLSVSEFVKNDKFEAFIILVIILNTIMLGSEYKGQPQEWTDVQTWCNMFFTVVFTFEMCLKIIGYGCISYLGDGFNVSDCLVVTLGLVEYMMIESKMLSVLRGFRILRIFKLFKRTPNLQHLVHTLLRAATDASGLGLIILIFILTNSLMGKQLFPCPVINEDGEESRNTFEDFPTAVMTVFFAMTGIWVEPMRDFIRQGYKWSVLYFLEVVILGHLFLLNLFLAILLQNFEESARNTVTKKIPEKVKECIDCDETEKALFSQIDVPVSIDESEDSVCTDKSFELEPSNKIIKRERRKSVRFCIDQEAEQEEKKQEVDYSPVKLQLKRRPSILRNNYEGGSSDSFEDDGTSKVDDDSDSSRQIYFYPALNAGIQQSSLDQSDDHFEYPTLKQKDQQQPAIHRRIQSQQVNSQGFIGLPRICERSDQTSSYHNLKIQVTQPVQNKLPDEQDDDCPVSLSSYNSSEQHSSGQPSMESVHEMPHRSYTSNATTNMMAPTIEVIQTENTCQQQTCLNIPALLNEQILNKQSSLRSQQTFSQYSEHPFCNNSGENMISLTVSDPKKDAPKLTSPSGSQSNLSHSLSEDNSSSEEEKLNGHQKFYTCPLGDEQRTIEHNMHKRVSCANKELRINMEKNMKVLLQQKKEYKEKHMLFFRQEEIIKKNIELNTDRQIKHKKIQKKHKYVWPLVIDSGYSLYTFKDDSPLRQTIIQIIKHSYFEKLSIYLIYLYSLAITVQEDKSIKDTFSHVTAEIIVVVISFLFIIEVFMRIIASGLIINEHSYLRDGFNVFDFILIITIFSSFVVAVFIEPTQTNDEGEICQTSKFAFVATTAKVFQTLRPLRLVKAREMRTTVESLLNALPSLGNALLLVLLALYIFSILGVQLFCGRLSYCMGEDETMLMELDKKECLLKKGKWETYQSNYDNIFSSMLTFFEIETLGEWHERAFQAMDSQSDIDLHPIKNQRRYLILLFIAFIWITTFLILNLIITILISSYQLQTAKMMRLETFDKQAQNWLTMQPILLKATVHPVPKPPANACRRVFYKIAQSDYFDHFISVCVSFNILQMCMEYDSPPKWYRDTLEWTEFVFVMIFLFEAFIKIVGMGFKMYFLQLQNNFDFFLVIVSLFGLLESFISINITAMRVVRGIRILRLFKSLKDIARLLNHLYESLMSFVYVLFLYVLVIFVFSLIGMRFYGDIEKGKLGVLGEDASFQDFQHAFTTLIRAETIENWEELMHDTMQTRGWQHCFFWISFIILKTHILMQIVIAVIIEKLDTQSNIDGSNEKELYRGAIANFVETWQELDPFATNFIKATDLQILICSLNSPLGFYECPEPLYGHQSVILLNFIKALNIRTRDGMVYFPEVLWALFFNLCGVSTPKFTKNRMMKEIFLQAQIKYPYLRKDLNYSIDDLFGNTEIVVVGEMSAFSYFCLVKMQRRWREKILRRKRREESMNICKHNPNSRQSLMPIAKALKRMSMRVAGSDVKLFPDDMIQLQRQHSIAFKPALKKPPRSCIDIYHASSPSIVSPISSPSLSQTLEDP